MKEFRLTTSPLRFFSVKYINNDNCYRTSKVEEYKDHYGKWDSVNYMFVKPRKH